MTQTGNSLKNYLSRSLLLVTLATAALTLIAFMVGGGRRLRTRRDSAHVALTTWPDGPTWRRCGWLALIYLSVAVPLGVLTGFLRWSYLSGLRRQVTAVIGLLIEPGFMEELIFRVWLLPHPTEAISTGRRWLSAVAGLGAFLLAHPLNGMTLSKSAYPLFTDGAFLLQAGLLGTTCTLAYFISGSIWPPMLIHWLPVTGWIIFFGGAKRVARSRWWAD